jgi:3-phenylpropionate/trans-cinnamate dioxygenase ferredoxin reductase subunit
MTMNHHATYLIVGAGLAGSSAAQAIRLRDPRGSVLMVGREINRPYHRPPLCREYLLRKASRADLITLPGEWFRDNRVQLVTGRRVARLDPARHAVALDTGEEVVYDRLLLATGVSPRPLNVPGADYPNVYDLRTIEDAEQIAHAIETARVEGRPHDPGNRSGPRGRVAVVGGGLLGVELSETFVNAGLKVDLLIAAPHPWGRFAGEHVGTTVARHLERNGITVHAGARVARLDGDGRVQRVVLDTPGAKPVDADFVVTAVGSVFNRELLRGTPINAEKHILVDQQCRTSVEDVFAAGDCAAILDPLFGKHRVLDHWDAARLTGTIAGANMAGDTSAIYDVVNQFSSEVFGLRLDAWGESKHVLHRHTRRLAGPAGGLLEFGIAASQRISQVLALSPDRTRPADAALLQEFVRRRLDVTGRAEALLDPTTDLQSLLT